MIIFGSKGNIVDLGSVQERYCPTCERDRPFHVLVTYRYGHIFWIPLFCWSTKYFFACSVCESGFELEKQEFKPYLLSNPIPWFHRFGWVVIGLIIFCLFLVCG